jgi:hypothetical protein
MDWLFVQDAGKSITVDIRVKTYANLASANVAGSGKIRILKKIKFIAGERGIICQRLP